MNKSLIYSMHSRLGYWIKFERKRLLDITNDPKLRQEKFILLDEGETFYDFVPNEAICSRSTLSRIENGKIVYEKTLINFFLKRFDKKFRINDFETHLIESTINAFHVYVFKNCNIDVSYLLSLCSDTNQKVSDNLLWELDYELLTMLIMWFEDYRVLNLSEFRLLVKKFKVYNESLREILIFYFCFSVFFNPDLWSYHNEIKLLIKDEYPDNDLLTIFEDLFGKQESHFIRSYYRNKHLILNESFLYRCSTPFKMIFEKHINIKKYNNLHYLCLIHKISNRDFTTLLQFEAELFSLLNKHEMEEVLNIHDLLFLIKDEPNPRIINKTVLQRIYPKIKSKDQMLKVLEFLLE